VRAGDAPPVPRIANGSVAARRSCLVDSKSWHCVSNCGWRSLKLPHHYPWDVVRDRSWGFVERRKMGGRTVKGEIARGSRSAAMHTTWHGRFKTMAVFDHRFGGLWGSPPPLWSTMFCGLASRGCKIAILQNVHSSRGQKCDRRQGYCRLHHHQDLRPARKHWHIRWRERGAGVEGEKQVSTKPGLHSSSRISLRSSGSNNICGNKKAPSVWERRNAR